MYLDDPQDFRENILWPDETKVKLCKGLNPVTCEVKWTWHFIIFFNHSSRQTWCSVMVCFDASGSGWLVTDGNMNSAPDQKILECQAIILCPGLLGLSRRTMIWNTPTSPPLIGSKIKKNVLQWPGQSPDINLIEMFWQDHKQAVHSCTLQCGSNKSASISSTAMWKTDCELYKHLNPVLAAADGTTSH